MGALFMVLSGTAFGILPWFVRVASDRGVGPLGMMTVRFSLATATLLVVRAIARRRGTAGNVGDDRDDRRVVHLRLALLGATGYAPQSILFFLGMQRIDISLGTVIFYTYPVLVVLGGWAVLHHRPNRTMALCLAVTVVGAALTAGEVGSGSFAGAVLMVLASLWYSWHVLVLGQLAPRTDALSGLTFMLCGATAVVVVGELVTRNPMPSDPQSWAACISAAYLCTVVALGLFVLGIRQVTAGEAAVLSTIEPVVSIAIGVVALGEDLTVVRLVGAVLVLIGVSSLARASRPRLAAPPGG